MNVIICNENYIPTDDVLFFSDNDGVLEDIYHAPAQSTIYDLLVKLGIFKSNSEARKNWTRGNIKSGYQEIKKIGKGRKELYILNPCEVMNE